MENPFRKGDRVRLKAWITKTKLGGLDRLFPQGCVGIATGLLGNVQGIPYLDLKVPTLEKSYHRVCVAIEDLESMPEQQVHVVKDGKVYELRNSIPGNFDCPNCAISHLQICRSSPCSVAEGTAQEYCNYQEVKSGKVVS